MSRNPRGAVISVRLSEDQQIYLKQLAEARKTSVSDLIRSYVANEMQPAPPGETVSTAPNDTAAHVDTGIVTWTSTGTDGQSYGTTLTVWPGKDFPLD